MIKPVQAEQLINVAEPSPYGRGEQTLHDPAVRRTWQIEPKRVHLGGRHWKQTLQDIVERAATGLGVGGPVQAEFYKLLIYDKGSFFVDHRDTEKSPGMFATLIIVLPADYSGGELLVRHRDREARLELQCPEPSSVAHAAFYADCVHEVLPITSGCRLTLVYNLLRQGDALPEPPDYRSQQDQVVDLLQQWIEAGQSEDGGGPEKLVHLLEHAYTRAELAFSTLKGADAAVASVLATAAPRAGCELHLALLTVEQTGGAEYVGGSYGSGRRWSEPDDDDFEIYGVEDESITLDHWQRPDGLAMRWGELPCLEDDLCPPVDFEQLEPDEQEFQEASGNEGATFERFYRRAALVVWPVSRRFAVFNQAGLSATLPYLKDLIQVWSDSDTEQDDAVWQMAHALAGHMMETWPQRAWSYQSAQQPTQVSEMLDCLVRLRDSAHMDTFLRTIIAGSVHDEGDNEALVRAVGSLPTAQALDTMERIVTANAPAYPVACAHLLRLCSEAPWLDGQPARLLDVARALVDVLPGDPQRTPTQPAWRPGHALNAGLVRNLFTALVRIDADLAMQTADYLLAWPEKYDLDRIILPAVLNLREEPSIGESAAVGRLSEACIKHLQARIAEPLAPPKDWARPADLSCKSDDCKALSQFLADPTRQTWEFRAAQARRSQVEQIVKSHNCDVDMRTIRSGSPHRLVCTKNQASYERRARQREGDLRALKQLE